jgi:hypothetical protein
LNPIEKNVFENVFENVLPLRTKTFRKTTTMEIPTSGPFFSRLLLFLFAIKRSLASFQNYNSSYVEKKFFSMIFDMGKRLQTLRFLSKNDGKRLFSSVFKKTGHRKRIS